ncbi:MAG: DUF116 domain-containing protein [Deltaproteobacteria bacterium]|nr:DUF116 domain-containing protein [Deltaproteobacteria bacterium]
MPVVSQDQTETESTIGVNSRKQDRKLGDEWSDWSGDLDALEPAITESKLKFMALGLVTVLLMTAGCLLLWYLAEPRLQQLAPAWRWAVHSLLVFGLVFPGLMYVLLFIQVVFDIRILPYRFSERFLFFLLPKAVWLGRRLGQSRDKVGHSFIKVNNAVTRLQGSQVGEPTLLILLPRCLQVSVRKEIKQMAQEYPCRMTTVRGGEEARKEIQKQRPDFIIAMACERDLITGIKDVALSVPVIGIPNQRPEGPCKNTLIPVEEFRAALDCIFSKNNRK